MYMKSLGAALALACLAMSAQATTTSSYNFSFDVGSGSTEATGSGTFLVDDTTNLVTGVTGSYSDSITSGAFGNVVALGTDGGFNYDNLFLTTGNHFTNNGLLVDVAGVHVNFYDDNGVFAVVDYIPGTSNYVNVDAGSGQGLTVSPTVSAVPEPANIALLLVGLGMVGFVARKRTAAI